jgi:hypothetical protein
MFTDINGESSQRTIFLLLPYVPLAFPLFFGPLYWILNSPINY